MHTRVNPHWNKEFVIFMRIRYICVVTTLSWNYHLYCVLIQCQSRFIITNPIDINNFVTWHCYNAPGVCSVMYATWLNCKEIVMYNLNMRLSWMTINTWKPEQSGHDFTVDIFKCNFVNHEVWISSEISLKCVLLIEKNQFLGNDVVSTREPNQCWPSAMTSLNHNEFIWDRGHLS